MEVTVCVAGPSSRTVRYGDAESHNPGRRLSELVVRRVVSLSAAISQK